MIQKPYDLIDTRKKDVVFETNNEIKYFAYNFEKNKNEIVICEELMYIQIYRLTFVKGKLGKFDYTFNLLTDLYVHETFFADKPFKIVEGMLYEKFKAIKLEVKGRLNKDTLKVYPDYHGMKDGDDQMSYDYPLVSDS